MSFLRSTQVQRLRQLLIRYPKASFIDSFVRGELPSPSQYIQDTFGSVEDAGIEVPDDSPTFFVQSIIISTPPVTIEEVPIVTLESGTAVQVQQSPEYQLIRSIPRPDVPRPNNLRTAAPVTRFNQTVATSLAESIAERKFGCLLHEPIRKDPVKIKECTVEELPQEEQDDILLNFALWLTKNVGDALLNTILPRACDLSIVAKTVFSGGGAGTIFTFVSCKILKYYILNEIASNLTALSIGVQSTVPTEIEYEDCEPIPMDEDGNDFELCNDPNTCFVPIRNLRSNLPGGEGYKTQIQIIFSDNSQALNDVRQITIPSPINAEDITKDLILESLYGSVPNEATAFEFGDIKYEIDVSPYGYIRYYGPIRDRPYDEIKTLFQRLVDNLVEGSINLDSFRASDRVRGFSGANDQPLKLFPVKALLFDFNTPAEAKCNRWDLRIRN